MSVRTTLGRSYIYLNKESGKALALGDERVSYRGVSAPDAAAFTYFGLLRDGIGTYSGAPKEELGSVTNKVNYKPLHHLVDGDGASALGNMESRVQSHRWNTRRAGVVSLILGFVFVFIYWGNSTLNPSPSLC